jgi:uncharacterized membrane protein YkoI
MKFTTLIGITTLTCLSLSTAFAQEQRIQMKDLPPAVQKTVREQSQGGRVRGLSKELDQGKTVYEAELLIQGKSKDMLIDETGAVIETEEQVALNSLPAAVRTALRKAAGKGRITLVEAVSKNGALAFYEAHVNTRGKVTEIKVSPDGQPL